MPHYLRADVLGWPIWYSPDVIDFINRVHRDGLTEIVWLTTWGQNAPERLAPALGLDAFRHLGGIDDFYHDYPDANDDLVSSSAGTAWWKAQRLLADARGLECDVIWTDDDLRRHTKTKIRPLLTGRALMITPMQKPGLTAEHMARIEDFILASDGGAAS